MTELNVNNIAQYMFNHTGLLDREAPLQIMELDKDSDPYAEGYVNYIFRISQGDRSYILKQARNYIKVKGIAPSLYCERNYSEYASFMLRDKILDGKFIPKIYHVDNFNAHEMRSIMEDIVLLGHKEHSETLVGQLGDRIWHTPEIRLELINIREVFANKAQCLIHGDLHTSNIFISESTLYVSDMEYSFMGPYGYDLGYLLANFVSQYCAFLFKPAAEKIKAPSFLQTIESVFTDYFHIFDACFKKDAKDIYKETPGFTKALFQEIFHDTLGFMAAANLSRVAGLNDFPDFDCIKNERDRQMAKILSILIDMEILLNRKNITTADGLIETIEKVTHDYMESKYGAMASI